MRTLLRTSSARSGLLVAACALGLACGGPDDRDTDTAAGSGAGSLGIPTPSGSGSDGDQSGSDGDPGGSDGGGTTGSGTSMGGGSSPDTGAVKFDLGVTPDSPPMEEEEGCKKVDLLFVIDNSGSMEDEQVNLVNSFPGFIDEIQTQLAGTEGYHVGVTTSDSYLYNSLGCSGEGSLVTKTGGTGASNMTCGPFAEGHNFMTEADDLATTFQCAAQVGIAGDGDERPMKTLGLALSPGLNAPGACNAGFLREDALLVVVVITDEEDDHEIDGCLQLPQPGSPGDPPNWYNTVVAAKGGVEQNIVVLTLIGPPGPDPAQCPPLDKCQGGIIGAEVSPRIDAFSTMFTYGFVGRVCEASYAAFFSEAVSVIKSACDEFVPPG